MCYNKSEYQKRIIIEKTKWIGSIMNKKMKLFIIIMLLIACVLFIKSRLIPDLDGLWMDPNGKTSMRFEGDQVEFIDLIGTYEIKKDELQMYFNGKLIVFKFKVKKDILILETEGSKIKLTKQEE